MNRDFAQWRRQYGWEIIGESLPVQETLRKIQRVAKTDCSILITGETGTGKELVARTIHRASERASKPFIPVNCAAIPESLLETVKGAFTGAMTARAGRFQSANTGTIFLDEIGDLPLAAQAKLLRVLEARTVQPVGSDTDVAVDVRVIAATHRDLKQMVAEGKFRADLYFRLAVVPLHLPALRDRGADIDLIVDACINRTRERLGRELTGITDSARATLRGYDFPGNVRELGHIIERAVLLASSDVLTEDDLEMPNARQVAQGSGQIPVLASGTSPGITLAEVRARSAAAGSASAQAAIAAAPPIAAEETMGNSLDLRSALEMLERQMIERALQRANGNRTEAAALLGLNRTTLVEKLRKYAA
jgi:sigma-54 dependent transcriptional regulator, flagellar regulatory protein